METKELSGNKKVNDEDPVKKRENAIGEVLNTNSNIPEKDKEKFKGLFKEILIEGKSPKDAMGYDDKMMEFIYKYGYQLHQAGRFTEAMEAFKLLSLLDITQPNYSVALGSCYMHLKEYPAAINAFAVALAVELNDPYPAMQMAECYLKMNDKYAALFMFDLAYIRASKNEMYNTVTERLSLTMETLKQELMKESKNKSA